MDRSKQLGEERVSRLLLKFSIPAIVGMLVNALYNVVDRMFIGHGVGTEALAGITIGFPIMLVTMAFGMLIGIGATSIISIYLGQQRKDEAEQALGNALVLLIGISLMVSVIGLTFINPLLRTFGASNVILPYARAYLTIILCGTVFMSIGFGMNNIIRAEGNPKIAMFTMLIGAILNTFLDWLFIVVFTWGIEGAAFATIISQAVSAIWVLRYFLSGKSLLKIHVKNMRLNSYIIRRIIAIGLAPFSMQIAASLLNVIMNNSLRYYGNDIAIAAMGVTQSIMMLIIMPIFGINQGVQPIIGYNYGAEKFNRVKEALKLAITAATVIVTVGFVAIRLYPEQFIAVFNREDEELIRLGTHTLLTFMMFLPIIGFQIVGANYFQAVGKPTQSMILSLSRQVLLLIPAMLILPRFLGFEGVLYAGPVADMGSAIITGLWLFKELKNLQQRHDEGVSPQPQPE